jgi:hypothetical protein
LKHLAEPLFLTPHDMPQSENPVKINPRENENNSLADCLLPKTAEDWTTIFA